MFVLQARAAQLLTITAKHFLGRLPGRVLTWGGGEVTVGCHVRTQGKQNNAKEGGNVRDGEMSDSCEKTAVIGVSPLFPSAGKLENTNLRKTPADPLGTEV